MTRTGRGILVLLVSACGSGTSGVAPAATAPPPAAAPAAPERMAEDTPKTTVAGNSFVAPAGWTMRVVGPATLLEPPEGDSAIALIDVQADSADDAVDAAWKAYRPDRPWPLEVSSEAPDKDGWSRIRAYVYRTSSDERRSVVANALYANGAWTVVIYDMLDAVGEKRGAQVGVLLGRLLPQGQARGAQHEYVFEPR